MADPETPPEGADAEDRIELSLDDLDDDRQQPAEDGRLVITGEDLADVPDQPPPAVGVGAPPSPGGPGGRVYPGLSNAAMASAMSPEALAAREKKGGLAAIRRSTTWQNVIAGALGGLIGWAILEPLQSDTNPDAFRNMSLILGAAIFFGIVGALIGACLGASEGIWAGSARKAVIGGGLGIVIGFAGGIVGGAMGQLVYGALARAGGPGTPFFIAVLVRALGWCIVGTFMGIGQGVAMRAWKKIINALIGGALGGLVGGLLFDPIGMVLASVSNEGWASRMVAIIVLGAACGAAIGIVEQLRKQAWLTIVEGPLAGKEFIIYTQITRIGSDPACEITLFKDPAIAPRHAQIEVAGANYILRDIAGLGTTYVNGSPVMEHRLRSGDYIQIGNTIIQYADRAFSIEQVQQGFYG